MLAKRTVNPDEVRHLAEVVSPEVARRLRGGLRPRPDGTFYVSADGLSLQEVVQLMRACADLGVPVAFHEQLSTDDLSEEAETILDWILLHDEPVEIVHRGHTLRLARVNASSQHHQAGP